MDNMFCLARKLEHCYKAQKPSLNASSMFLFVERKLFCSASSLLSCL